MGKIVLDPALREKLNGLNEQVQVHDENDELVGVFLPLDYYNALLPNLDIPLTQEEIGRRKQEKGVCTLDEIWKKLGAK